MKAYTLSLFFSCNLLTYYLTFLKTGSMAEDSIEFQKLKIHPSYGDALYDVYYVVENKKSKVIEKFSTTQSE